jgi:hypothetical protein
MRRFERIKYYYALGERFITDPYHIASGELDILELNKVSSRTEIINFLLSRFSSETNYLEIGVRNPEDNFNKIMATNKYSVDPGVEFEQNPVDFQMTSDAFFSKLEQGDILNSEVKFDLIFIDGLHLANQVDKDVSNALKYIKEDGFIVMHDCNPPTEWHAREEFKYSISPALLSWNGTTWKAFQKYRFDPQVFSCCIDTDWGVGILSKTVNVGESILPTNPFYEFNIMDSNRKQHLNLKSFEELKQMLV